MRWTIRCRVVDNFGDAGVCWRVARELASSPDDSVRLAIDRPDVLARLVPDVAGTGPAPSAADVVVDGVHVVPWSDRPDDADVVVAAFGCRLPDPVLAAMATRQPAPVWIDLEYLSAEDWVIGCHGLPSPHGRHALVEHFYFPGFGDGTGGLPREPGLLEARDRFRATPAARDALLAALGVAAADRSRPAVLLFAYDDAPVGALVDALAEGPPALLLVPEGVANGALAAAFGAPSDRPPPSGERGAVRMRRIPFVPQATFDPLLWSCAAAFVRGEDSLVRAHWAGIPFVWQPYRQDEEAHRAKLCAWLARGREAMGGPAAEALDALALAWDAGDARRVRSAWLPWRARLAAATAGTDRDDPLLAGAAAWSARLAARPALVPSLRAFVRDRLESRAVEGAVPADRGEAPRSS